MKRCIFQHFKILIKVLLHIFKILIKVLRHIFNYIYLKNNYNSHNKKLKTVRYIYTSSITQKKTKKQKYKKTTIHIIMMFKLIQNIISSLSVLSLYIYFTLIEIHKSNISSKIKTVIAYV